jgi:hypothetical protein
MPPTFVFAVPFSACMIQLNEADVPKMVTDRGKRLDGEALSFEPTSET